MDISGTVAAAGVLTLAAAAAYIAYYALRSLGWIQKLPEPSIRSLLPEPMAAVLLLFVLSRVVLYVLGTARIGYTGSLSDGFLTLWTGPDSEHFVRISRFGYEPGTEHENLIVFYPLFPALMRLFSFVFRSPELSGIIISNICFAVACVWLYKLCLECGLTETEGVAAAAFMIAFPFSFFSMSCYTESLFLMLTIGCALMLRQKKWLFAGMLGMLAALTRTQGVLCFAMAAYEAADALVKKREDKPARLLWLLLIPMGYIAYLCLNKALYGSFFAYMAFERASPWYQHADWIWNNLKYNVSMGEQYAGLAKFIYLPQLLLFFLMLLCLMRGAREKLPPSLLIYGGLSVLMSYTASWLISGGRYMFAVFPVYMALARYTRRHKLAGALIFLISLAFLLFYMYSHLRGEAVM